MAVNILNSSQVKKKRRKYGKQNIRESANKLS